MAGDFLPIQLVYKGKTPHCLPNVESVPEGWHLTYSPSHWSTEQTMRDYIQKIVVPYIEKMRQTSRLADNYPALLLFDNFKAQCTQELLTLLDDNFINVLLIPPNCTDRLQPMDISVNNQQKIFCVASLNLGMPNKSIVNFEERIKRLQLICDLVL